MWGGTLDEIIGKPFTDFIYPDELPLLLDRYQRRMAGEDVTPTYETAFKRKDGSKAGLHRAERRYDYVSWGASQPSYRSRHHPA